MQFAANVQANWQEVYCFIMTRPDPIQPEESRTEFKKNSRNFLNIILTTRLWPLLNFICLLHYKKTTLVANVSLMTKSLNGGSELAEKAVKRLMC
jgi:hypothetical protein